MNRPRSFARIGRWTVVTPAVGRRHDRDRAARIHGTRSHVCTLIPDVCANRMLNATPPPGATMSSFCTAK